MEMQTKVEHKREFKFLNHRAIDLYLVKLTLKFIDVTPFVDVLVILVSANMDQVNIAQGWIIILSINSLFFFFSSHVFKL